jgi:hypothetical protein
MLDGVIDDSPIALHYPRAIPGRKYAYRFEGTEGEYAVMIRRGNASLRDQINVTLAQMESMVRFLLSGEFGSAARTFSLHDASSRMTGNPEVTCGPEYCVPPVHQICWLSCAFLDRLSVSKNSQNILDPAITMSLRRVFWPFMESTLASSRDFRKTSADPIAVSILGSISQPRRSKGRYSCSVPRSCAATTTALLQIATEIVLRVVTLGMTCVGLSSIGSPMGTIRLHKRPTPGTGHGGGMCKATSRV